MSIKHAFQQITPRNIVTHNISYVLIYITSKNSNAMQAYLQHKLKYFDTNILNTRITGAVILTVFDF